MISPQSLPLRRPVVKATVGIVVVEIEPLASAAIMIVILPLVTINLLGGNVLNRCLVRERLDLIVTKQSSCLIDLTIMDVLKITPTLEFQTGSRES